MLIGDWAGIGRMLVIGPLVYLSLVLLLRMSGKRTLSKLNAFDLVVTVALGSTLSTAILSKETPLADGIAALAVLISLQFLVAWLSVRFATVRKLVRAEPRMLVYQGELLARALREERLTEDEVRQALRQQGVAAIERVHAAVLENDGRISVIESNGESNGSALPEAPRDAAGDGVGRAASLHPPTPPAPRTSG